MRIQITAFILIVLLSFSVSSATARESFQISEDSNTVFWIDTDLGFDVDDLIAIVGLANHIGPKIVGVSTTMFHPEKKAVIAKLVFTELGFPTIPVFAGLGIYKGNEDNFSLMYPNWPNQFGVPYPKQGIAFEKVYGSSLFSNTKAYIQEAAVDAIINAIHKNDRKLIIIALGPLTNIAAAIKKDPSIAKKINNLVVMGGWFLENKIPIRLGYNTLLDVQASSEIFSNIDLRTTLVNSQTVKTADLRIKKDQEYSMFQSSESKTKLGEALFQEMSQWLEHSKNTMGDIVLADPVTALVAVFPSIVKEKKAIEVQLKSNSKIGDEKKNGLFPITGTTHPHLYIIEAFHYPELIRQDIISSLKKLFNPKESSATIDR